MSKKPAKKITEAMVKDTLLKPVIQTGDTKFDQEINEIIAQAQFQKIRRWRKELSKQYGVPFDDWYALANKIDFIKSGKKEILEFVKGIQKYKQLALKPKQLVAPVKPYKATEEAKWYEYDKNPPAKNDYSPSALVYYLYIEEAKNEGKTYSEYMLERQRRRDHERHYEQTHWVKPLTEGQIFTILYRDEHPPYKYMNKPLSSLNISYVEHYKKWSKGWKEFKAKRDAKKSNDQTYVVEKFKDEELQKAVLKEQAVLDQIQKTLDDVETKIPITFNPFNLNDPKRADINVGGLLDIEIKKNKPIEIIKVGNQTIFTDYNKGERIIKEKDSGLNSYARRIDAKNGVDVALHYLKTHEDPTKVDYAPIAFSNAGALADSVGMLPAELFKITCDYIKKKESDYRTRLFEIEQGYLIEMLVNEYLSICDSKLKANITYNAKLFYQSQYVKNFLKQSGMKLDYQRFSKKLTNWIKIYTATAKKIDKSEQ